jgi:pimeloyl-ACP methyl ester carboxylesterase
MRSLLAPLCVAAVAASSCASLPGDGAHVVRTDHFVTVKSPAPGLAGAESKLYVREVALDGAFGSPIPPADRVVLFIHGSGTPAEVSFDVGYKDYSWMAYLARAGFDTFSLSLTGYGGSTRPAAMNEPCNQPKTQQQQFVPAVMPETCDAKQASAISTMDSDWAEIAAVVDHLRKLRGVQKVSIVAWSQGGPRSAGYAARNPDKVSRIFALAPSYVRDMPATAPTTLPNGPMNVQSHKDFVANWDRQVGCPDQYEPAASEAIWREMLASDPVGARWGAGVRRAPNVNSYGFNQAMVAKLQVPYAMATGEHDKQVPSERVRALYEDLGARDKVLIEMACSSHNAMWERNHTLLFKASLDWLKDGQVAGARSGVVRLGYR